MQKKMQIASKSNHCILMAVQFLIQKKEEVWEEGGGN
jgi:hypothetical protein